MFLLKLNGKEYFAQYMELKRNQLKIKLLELLSRFFFVESLMKHETVDRTARQLIIEGVKLVVPHKQTRGNNSIIVFLLIS